MKASFKSAHEHGRKTDKISYYSRPGRLQLFTLGGTCFISDRHRVQSLICVIISEPDRIPGCHGLSNQLAGKDPLSQTIFGSSGPGKTRFILGTDRSHPTGCSRDIFKEASLLVKAANRPDACTNHLVTFHLGRTADDVEINRPYHSLSGLFAFSSFASSWFIRVTISLSREIAPSLATL